ncbi:MAG TPA: helix-turn-helix domain-containing protein, partial [Opitutaceae bacterium]
MDKATYRTGQAAHILNVSSHQIRRLCEVRMIHAELTAGNRWRIPASEVDRLKRDGVPPIPRLDLPATVVRSHAPQSENEDRDDAPTPMQSEYGLP